MRLSGKKVSLRPMTLEELPEFYKQAIKNPFWYGEFSDEPVPTYEKFRQDWKDYYFDGSQPEKGRCLTIIADGKVVGEINYEIDSKDSAAELDILIYDEAERGKGYGPDAEATVTEWLFEGMGVNRVFIEHVTQNNRAIRSSEKAGFHETKKYSKNSLEWVRMEKYKQKSALQ